MVQYRARLCNIQNIKQHVMLYTCLTIVFSVLNSFTTSRFEITKAHRLTHFRSSSIGHVQKLEPRNSHDNTWQNKQTFVYIIYMLRWTCHNRKTCCPQSCRIIFKFLSRQPFALAVKKPSLSIRIAGKNDTNPV